MADAEQMTAEASAAPGNAPAPEPAPTPAPAPEPAPATPADEPDPSDSASERAKQRTRPHRRAEALPPWQRLSYRTRVTIAFVAISVMTTIIAFGILSLVWGQHFQAYTYEKMERLSGSTADAIADNYRDVLSWSPDVLAPAASAAGLNANVGVQVVDAGGTVRYDNQAKSTRNPFAPNRSMMISSPIIVDGEEVGMVNVWVYGSQSMLTRADLEYLDESNQAMLAAAFVAILVSIGFGLVFARSLVNPINRMTRTAKAIKEGDLSARTGLTGDDEVAHLGETFDAMADAIEKDRMMERRLTTDVAHELRTPLMAIQSTVEAMVDGVFEPDAERLATVNAEVQRLSRLVDALLKLSRLENRKIPMNKVRLNLGDLLTDIIGTHEAYVRDAGLNLVFESEPDVWVFGDADMLRQATANLISNAVRYTPEGTITVRVRRHETMGSIAVADTGIGLTPEECKQVFGRFWRGDAGRNRAQGGLGIGLSVVKEIIDRHNGWVRVEGEKGVGATFTLFLPLYDENRESGRSGARRERNRNGRKDRNA